MTYVYSGGREFDTRGAHNLFCVRACLTPIFSYCLYGVYFHNFSLSLWLYLSQYNVNHYHYYYHHSWITIQISPLKLAACRYIQQIRSQEIRVVKNRRKGPPKNGLVYISTSIILLSWSLCSTNILKPVSLVMLIDYLYRWGVQLWQSTTVHLVSLRATTSQEQPRISSSIALGLKCSASLMPSRSGKEVFCGASLMPRTYIVWRDQLCSSSLQRNAFSVAIWGRAVQYVFFRNVRLNSWLWWIKPPFFRTWRGRKI